MTYESPRSEDLIEDYISSGWSVVDPRARRPDIDFLPDYLLRKGDDYLVVEVKQAGFPSERSIADMRRIVEKQPHWRFVVKLQPLPSSMVTNELAADEVPARVSIAEKLLSSGHREEAILIAWIAIEASLRRLLAEESPMQADAGLPVLLRSAYEAEVISDVELRQIDHAKALRNQIVHGFKVSATQDDAERILSLTRVISDRVVALDSGSSPSFSP